MRRKDLGAWAAIAATLLAGLLLAGCSPYLRVSGAAGRELTEALVDGQRALDVRLLARVGCDQGEAEAQLIREGVSSGEARRRVSTAWKFAGAECPAGARGGGQ